jgi:hypothetical protein
VARLWHGRALIRNTLCETYANDPFVVHRERVVKLCGCLRRLATALARNSRRRAMSGVSCQLIFGTRHALTDRTSPPVDANKEPHPVNRDASNRLSAVPSHCQRSVRKDIHAKTVPSAFPNAARKPAWSAG